MGEEKGGRGGRRRGVQTTELLLWAGNCAQHLLPKRPSAAVRPSCTEEETRAQRIVQGP